VMSEMPYLLLSLLALLCVSTYAAETRWRSLTGTALAATLAAALLTRSIGVALLVAALGHLLLQGPRGVIRLKKAIFVGGTCLACWLGANLSTASEIPYIREFDEGAVTAEPRSEERSLGQRVLTNVRAYHTVVPEAVVYPLYWHPSRVLATLVDAILLIGYLAVLLRRVTAMELYVSATVAVLLLYEAPNLGNIQRYVVPLIPFLLYYFAIGLHALVRVASASLRPAGLLGKASPQHVVTALLVLLMVTNFTFTVRASVLDVEPEMFDYYRYSDAAGLRVMAQWAGRHTPANSVVGTNSAYLFHYWSRRQVTWLPEVDLSADQDEIVRELRSSGVNYLAGDTTQFSPLIEALRDIVPRRRADLELVYAVGGQRMYRIRPESRTPADLSGREK
jgi:hypothetical protein